MILAGKTAAGGLAGSLGRFRVGAVIAGTVGMLGTAGILAVAGMPVCAIKGMAGILGAGGMPILARIPGAARKVVAGGLIVARLGVAGILVVARLAIAGMLVCAIELVAGVAVPGGMLTDSRLPGGASTSLTNGLGGEIPDVVGKLAIKDESEILERLNVTGRKPMLVTAVVAAVSALLALVTKPVAVAFA